jgi:hypothetical protein
MPDFGFTLVLVLVVLAAVIVLPRRLGFMAQRPADYAGSTPAIDIRQHLSGPILCEGVIYGPTGRVTSRFVAQMEGRWEGTAAFWMNISTTPAVTARIASGA